MSDSNAGMGRFEVVSDPTMDRVRARRLTLRSAMSALEGALAKPASDRIEQWKSGAGRAAADLEECLRDHVGETEGPHGFHTEMLTAAPRLSHAVESLAAEHVVLLDEATTLTGQVSGAASRADVESARELGTTLIGRISRHRQRGADLIYEAYEYDIGGED